MQVWMMWAGADASREPARLGGCTLGMYITMKDELEEARNLVGNRMMVYRTSVCSTRRAAGGQAGTGRGGSKVGGSLSVVMHHIGHRRPGTILAQPHAHAHGPLNCLSCPNGEEGHLTTAPPVVGAQSMSSHNSTAPTFSVTSMSISNPSLPSSC